MNTVGQREIRTQQRVVEFFRGALGYTYLGDWQDRPNNRNIEPDLLTGWLKRQRYDGIITSLPAGCGWLSRDQTTKTAIYPDTSPP